MFINNNKKQESEINFLFNLLSSHYFI